MTPPFLDLALAVPAITGVIVIQPSDDPTSTRIEVKVPVRSEDQGKDLVGALHVDYSYADVLLPRSGRLEASFLGNTKREMTIITDVRGVKPGCHYLTLLVAHEGNIDPNTLIPIPRLDENGKEIRDLAMATWVVNVSPPAGSNLYTLTNCPNRNAVQAGP